MRELSSKIYQWQNVNTQLTALPSLTISVNTIQALIYSLSQTKPISLNHIIISAASAGRTRVNRRKREIIESSERIDSMVTRTESQGWNSAVDL